MPRSPVLRIGIAQGRMNAGYRRAGTIFFPMPVPPTDPPRGRLVFLSALAVLFFADLLAWYVLFSGRPANDTRMYFLDVGQGDSEVAVLPGGVSVMTDAGPTNAVLGSFDRVLPGRRYIDLAVITHPQLDHFNGYNFILDHYGVGAILYNGRDDPGVAEWTALRAKIAAKHIPLITLGAGDRIHYRDDEIDILSPDDDFIQSAELNDTGLVELVRTPQFRALLTADIGSGVEDRLVRSGIDLRADILKVAHHGSKYSSSEAFLAAVRPAVAVIEVGAKNTYGQPGPATLARFASTTRAEIFRTDQNGTVEISYYDNGLQVSREK